MVPRDCASLVLWLIAGCGTPDVDPVPAPEAAEADAAGVADDDKHGIADPDAIEPTATSESFDEQNVDPGALMTMLPSISESYEAAEGAGYTKGWEIFVAPENPDFGALDEHSRALAVGQSLSDVGFRMAKLGEGETPPKSLVSRATLAIAALDPPAAIQSDADTVLKQIQSGDLQGAEAVAEVERLVRNTLPTLKENHRFTDAANAALLGAFLRTTSVAARGMAANDALDPVAFGHLRQDAVADYFIAWFDQKASATWKGAEPIQKALAATKQVRGVMAKPEDLTRQDVNTIAQTLADYAG